jgi:putative oxidoreductase
MNKMLTRWMPQVLSAVRIMASLLFIEHGTQKLLGFPAPGPRGVAELLSMTGFEGCLEIFGGALLAVGFQTRIVAFLLSGKMAVGYFMVHAPRSFYPVLNNGDAAILFCFIFLLFVFSGGGAWSIDSILGRNPKRSE